MRGVCLPGTRYPRLVRRFVLVLRLSVMSASVEPLSIEHIVPAALNARLPMEALRMSLSSLEGDRAIEQGARAFSVCRYS